MKNKPLLFLILLYLAFVLLLPSFLIWIFNIFPHLSIRNAEIGGLFKFQLISYVLGCLVLLINLISLFILKSQSVISKVLLSVLFSIVGLMTGVFVGIYLAKSVAESISINDLNFFMWGIIGAITFNLLFILIIRFMWRT